jgi:hypothetical protein
MLIKKHTGSVLPVIHNEQNCPIDEFGNQQDRTHRQARWQATKCPSLPCFSSGALSRQRGSAIGQRVWK